MKENFYNKKNVKYLKMLKGGKPTRNSKAEIIKPGEFQSSTSSTGRIHPDRKWFCATKTVSQVELEEFRSGIKVETPYNVLVKTGNVPYSLLKENTKLKKKVDHSSVFGKNAVRKKPVLICKNLEDLARMKKEKEGKTEEKVEYKEAVKGQSSRIWLELYKVLDSSDVIIHVLDARNPTGTLCEKISDYIKEEAPHKHLIYVLNKVDLIPTGVTAKWMKYLSKKNTTLAYHSNSLHHCYGKVNLLNILKQLEKLYNKRNISVGFVGYPNVGKSSIINTLRNKVVCNVAPVPGETKVWQYITLTKGIYLIDCPGVVPVADYDQAVLKGAIRVENIETPEEYVEMLLKKAGGEISRVYKVEFTSTEDFLEKMAVKYGKLQRGGEANLDVVAKMVLHDWNRGKIPYYEEPPFDTN